MPPFLQEVAEALYQQHGSNLYRIHVVLPSRRAAMYFQLYLQRVVQQPIIAPNILSMDDFVQQMSRLKVPSQVTLLLRLFNTYKQFDAKREHNLERFTPLGLTLLKDFSMLDKNLTEARALEVFEYLKEVKALERWRKELGENFDLTQHLSLLNYFAFWEYLEQTYRTFRRELLAEGLAYSGLAYRKVHENLEALAEEKALEHVAFVGFSQMTGAEEDIIRTLLKLNKASTFWDADLYYMANEWHEAGDYIRNYQKRWLSSDTPFANLLATTPKTVELVAAPNELSQARYAGQLVAETIEKFQKEGALEALKQQVNQVGILLPDGSMLNPVLHSLPDYAERGFPLAQHLNLTMGISLRNSQLADLVVMLFQMQERAQQRKRWSIYYHDFEHLLAHPYVLMYPETRTAIEEILLKIRKENQAYITQKEIQEHFREVPFLRQLFEGWEGSFQKAIQQLKQLCSTLDALVSPKGLDHMQLYQFYMLLNNLEEAFATKTAEDISLRTFRFFLLELMKNQSVPFTGDPISPFQIMGMLESRTLDFEHVIVLSCNEGHLPKSKVLDSVLPFGMRAQYKLPTYQENDGSFAYTFYRLFHRAKRITLVYNTAAQSGGGLAGGEVSRFIQQIEQEWKAFPNINIVHRAIRLPNPEFTEKQQDTIEKDEAVLNALRHSMQKGFSPSAINTYISNPLEFFYKNVLKFTDPEEVEEWLDTRTFGTILHKALEDILKPHIGQVVTAEMLAPFLRDDTLLRDCIKKAVQYEKSAMDIDTGRNYLLQEAALDLIKRYLNQEQKGKPFQVVLLEQYLEGHATFPDPVTGALQRFRVAGMADRIDLQREQGYYHLRIIDYKTGSYEKAHLKASDRTVLLLESEKAKIIQLLLYKFLVISEIQRGSLKGIPEDFDLERDKISSGFVFFRKLSHGYVQYQLADAPENYEAFLTYTHDFLKVIGQDVLNPAKLFTVEPSDFQPYIQKFSAHHNGGTAQ